MRNNKNHPAALIAAAFLGLLLPSISHAQSLSLNKIADLAFGTIDFAAPTASGDVTMGTNGTITYGTNTSGGGSGTPGQIEIVGTAGTTVTIACDASADMAFPGHTALPVNPIRFVVGTANTGDFASATECTGTSTSVFTTSISAVSSENIIVIGGNLAINGITLANGTYDGSNSGGVQPVFQVLVQ